MVTIDTTLVLPPPSTDAAKPDVWGAKLNATITRLAAAIEALNAGKPDSSALAELIQDVVAAMLVPGSGVGVLYNDTAGTLTLTNTSSGGSTDAEVVRDTIGAALAAGTNITLTVDDANDKITIAAANTTDAEVVRDVLGATLRAGTNVTLVVDDANDTVTINAASSSTGGSSTGGTAVTVESDASRPNVMLLRISDGSSSSGTLPSAAGQPTITAA